MDTFLGVAKDNDNDSISGPVSARSWSPCLMRAYGPVSVQDKWVQVSVQDKWAYKGALKSPDALQNPLFGFDNNAFNLKGT